MAARSRAWSVGWSGWALSVWSGGGVMVAAEAILDAMDGATVAGDYHPGHGAVTRQPPARLRAQGSSPAGFPSETARPPQQAVQIDGDQQLRADPTGRGQPTTFQSPAGQLGQGIGIPLAAATGIVGVGWACQRLQSGQQGGAGFGFQQPIHRHHAFPGRRQP